MTRLCHYSHRAVTLLEVILAMGILVAVSSMTFWFYASSLETSRDGISAAQDLRLVRVTLDRMAKEIRQAAASTADYGVGLRGEAERISLVSYRVPSREQSKKRTIRSKPRPAEYDLTTVEYKIVRHPEVMHPDNYEMPLGLARVEKPIPRAYSLASLEIPEEEKGGFGSEDGDGSEDTGENDNAADESLSREDPFAEEEEQVGDAAIGLDIRWGELYAPTIHYLRFCYYDGNRWWDSWDIAGENPLPQLVRVTIGFGDHPPFGEGVGRDDPNEEFCTCLNETPVDCVPLLEDQYSITVRLSQADPLFRSRVNRETKAFVEELSAPASEEEEEE